MTKLSLKERLAQLGPARAVSRHRSGFAVDAVLRPADKIAQVKTVDAMQTLVRYGVKLLNAKRTIEGMLDKGEATVHVPSASGDLAPELRAAGIRVSCIAKKPVDVRELREKLALTQDEFARRYGIPVRTVQNWEQGRPPDPAANNFLLVIASNAAVAGEALESDL